MSVTKHDITVTRANTPDVTVPMSGFWQAGRKTDRQTDRQACNRQTDRQTNRQTERQVDDTVYIASNKA